MSRILFAFELGGNFGHLVPAYGLIKALFDDGHKLTVVGNNVSLMQQLGIDRLAVIQTPPKHTFIGYSNKTNTAHFTHNFSEILLRFGWSDHYYLVSMINAWSKIIIENQIDIVVGDFSPTAILTTHVLGIKYLSIGVGWTIPSSLNHARFMKEHLDVNNRSMDFGTQVNRTLTKLCSHYQINEIKLNDLFENKYLITTYPELDCYNDRAKQCIGPIAANELLFRNGIVEWKTNKVKIFVYIRSKVRGFQELVRALVKLDAEIICMIPDIAMNHLELLRKHNVEVHVEPITLSDDFLKQANLVINYGGQNVTNQALGLGVPMLCLSMHQESEITSLRVEEIGAGIFLKETRDIDSIASCIEKLLTNSKYSEAAQTFAVKYQNWTVDDSVAKVIEKIDNL